MQDTVTLYHNPRCSKSRAALALLEENGIKPTIVRYLETPPSAQTLRSLCQSLRISPRELLRTNEDAYKELDLAASSTTDTDIIKAMVAHPKLIQRPIAVKGDRAVLGRPPESILELLS